MLNICKKISQKRLDVKLKVTGIGWEIKVYTDKCHFFSNNMKESLKRSSQSQIMYCQVCRKKSDNLVVDCSDCKQWLDKKIMFVLPGPHRYHCSGLSSPSFFIR